MCKFGIKVEIMVDKKQIHMNEDYFCHQIYLIVLLFLFALHINKQSKENRQIIALG